MLKLRGLLMLSSVAAIASCAPRPAPQPPEPRPQPQQQAPRPQPIPVPPAPTPGWQEAPLTSGQWGYSGQGTSSAASFGAPGQPLFVVRCEPSRQVSLARIGPSSANALTLRTSSGARSIAATPQQGALVSTLPASDRFLDALAFSRGRFTVEANGMPMLIVPAWPEVARVVEDCRA